MQLLPLGVGKLQQSQPEPLGLVTEGWEEKLERPVA